MRFFPNMAFLLINRFKRGIGEFPIAAHRATIEFNKYA